MSRPSSPAPQPSWHFPFGPSSKYHQRERSHSQSTRFRLPYPANSPSPSPVAPMLSTERRAHRRAQSSLPNLYTPPGSDRTASRQSSNYPSYTTAAIARGSRTSSYSPITPLKSPPSSIRLLQDSPPYSDYFTDEDARSVVSTVPSPAVQQVLVRLAKLQSQLMRGESQSGQAAVNLVRQKLGEIEVELQAASVRQDSGVFSGDEESEDGAAMSVVADKKPLLNKNPTPPIPQSPTFQNVNTSDKAASGNKPTTTPTEQIVQAHFLTEMQRLLTNLRDVQIQLRQRCIEVRTLNERHAATIDEHEQQFEQLRSQNESLRADLGFEYSELLFLKLQLKALEVEVQSLGDAEDDEDVFRRSKRNRILAEMDRWRADWQDVHARFQRRKTAYGGGFVGLDIDDDEVSKRHDKLRDLAENNNINRPLEVVAGDLSVDTDWQLETFVQAEDHVCHASPRGPHRRVTSLTITRVDSHSGPRPTLTLPVISAEATDDTINELEMQDAIRAEQSQISSTPELSTTLTDELPSLDTSTTCAYISQGTQTDVSMALLADDVDEPGHESYDEYTDDHDDALSETASENELHSNANGTLTASLPDTPLVESKMPRKSAWQELCEGLTNLAGMGDDRF